MNTAVVHLIEVRTPNTYLTRDQRCLNKEFIATYEIYGLNVCVVSTNKNIEFVITAK